MYGVCHAANAVVIFRVNKLWNNRERTGIAQRVESQSAHGQKRKLILVRYLSRFNGIGMMLPELMND